MVIWWSKLYVIHSIITVQYSRHIYSELRFHIWYKRWHCPFEHFRSIVWKGLLPNELFLLSIVLHLLFLNFEYWILNHCSISCIKLLNRFLHVGLLTWRLKKAYFYFLEILSRYWVILEIPFLVSIWNFRTIISGILFSFFVIPWKLNVSIFFLFISYPIITYCNSWAF